MRNILLGLTIFLSGCSTFALEQKTFHKLMLPLNAAIGYFGSVAIHEQGHALTAYALGARDVSVTILPTHNDNEFHLGLTTATFKDPSDLDISIFRTMGPVSNMCSSIVVREILKSGTIPEYIQPTLAWLSVSNHVSFYFHILAGLGRFKQTDLGKEPIWISATLLSAVLAYDTWDFIFNNNFPKIVEVMLGESFYTEDSRHISLIPLINKDQKFLGIQFDW